jgi:hypothetical protein
MIRFATNPSCGQYEEHEAHPWAPDLDCRGMSQNAAEVRRIVTSVVYLNRALEMAVFSGEEAAQMKFRAHPHVLNCIRREVLPDYSELIGKADLTSMFSIPVEADITLEPGEWRLSVAEGKMT